MKPARFLSLFAAVGLSLVTVTASAQDTSKKQALAAQLLEQLEVQKMFDTTLDSIPKMQSQMMGSKLAPADKAEFDKKMAKAMVAVKQSMSWDQMKPIFIKIYADNFDESDLQGMIAFYKTSVGQKWIQKQPAIQAATVQAMSGIMPQVQAAMMKSFSEGDATAP